MMQRFSYLAILTLCVLSPVYAQTRHAASYIERGNEYFTKGEVELAITDFDTAITLDPNFTGSYYNRAIARQSKGDFAGAFTDYDRAIQLNPRFAAAYVNRSHLHYLTGELEEAFSDSTRAIKFDPRIPEAYNNLGLVRQDKGDVDGAIADFDRAIKLTPRDVTGRPVRRRAQIHNNRGVARCALARRDLGDMGEGRSPTTTKPQRSIAA